MATSITGSSIIVGSIDLGTPLTVTDGGTGQTTIKAAIDTIRFTSTEQVITAAGTLSIAHGLGVVPFSVHAFLKCTTAELGYSIGDILAIGTSQQSTAAVDTGGISIVVTDTYLVLRYGSLANTFTVNNKTTGAGSGITNANWKLIVKAEA